jgi:ATP-dependent DNA ligase
MSSYQRMLPLGFLRPCLPIKAPQPPSGDIWLHEIKLDGFRVIARKDGERVRLYSRPGNDLTKRFPLIAEAMAALRSRSCIIDGEAVVLGDDGLPSFDRLRYRRRTPAAWLGYGLRYSVGITVVIPTFGIMARDAKTCFAFLPSS